MTGAGARPTAGARYAFERATEERDVVYRGFVHLPDEDVAVEVRVELPGGATKASLVGGEGSERDKELAKTAAALIRSATKAGAATGGPFPRKIVRWRNLKGDADPG